MILSLFTSKVSSRATGGDDEFVVDGFDSPDVRQAAHDAVDDPDEADDFVVVVRTPLSSVASPASPGSPRASTYASTPSPRCDVPAFPGDFDLDYSTPDFGLDSENLDFSAFLAKLDAAFADTALAKRRRASECRSELPDADESEHGAPSRGTTYFPIAVSADLDLRMWRAGDRPACLSVGLHGGGVRPFAGPLQLTIRRTTA